jgi:hypothetical protein
MPEAKRRPGDQILDSYAPNLTADERTEAHERLRSLARILIRIHRRLDADDIPADDSTHFRDGDRIPSLPTS